MNTHLNNTLIATIATLMLSTAFHAVAQDSNHSTNDYRWKIELGASMDFLQDKMPQFHHNKLGGGLYIETRYRIGETPVDVGLYGSWSAVPRVHRTSFNGEIFDENNQPIGTFKGYGEGDVGFSAVNVMATVSYNHRFSRHCEGFVGAGIGICSYQQGKNWEVIGEDEISFTTVDHGGISLALMPRAGVLLFNHLRLTAGYKMQEKGNRHAFVSVGFVLPIGKR